MSAFKTWTGLIVCVGLGLLFVSGYQIPLDPGCVGRCRLDSLARLQRDIGGEALAVVFFALGIFGFFWYSRGS